MHEGMSLTEPLILLAGAVALSMIFQRLRLPSTMAYLCLGLIVGPQSLGLISGVDTINFIAELGIVFLLFTLGLEFSLPRMIAMRQHVFVAGGIQVVTCALMFWGLARLFGASNGAALVVAGALALSSTAVVSRELTGRNELNQPHGRITISILLFQDIAAVLFLILVPALGQADTDNLPLLLGITLAKGVVLFIGLLAIGRWILPPLFSEITRSRSNELFILLVLLVSLLAAGVTHAVGLSMALGAFITGMMLSETHYRHQIEVSIRPFRDLLLGLFFASVGMMLDPRTLLTHGHWILLLSAILLLSKTTLIAGIVRLRGESADTAVRTGLYLSQGGEFGFALFSLAGKHHLVSGLTVDIVVASIILTIMLTPPLIGQLAPRLLKHFAHSTNPEPQTPLQRVEEAGAELHQHAILLGFGRVGQTVARFLRKQGLPYIAVDTDPLRVREASLAGENVHYGDGSTFEMLEALGLARARLVVMSHKDMNTLRHTLENIRKHDHTLPVLVRTSDDSALDSLMKAGATEVVPETLEASLTLVSHAMTLMEIPATRIFQEISEARRSRYKILHGYYHGLRSKVSDPTGRPLDIMHPVTLPDGALACGRTLQTAVGDDDLRFIDKLRRDDHELDITPEQTLKSGDTVVLLGTADVIERVESHLLAGRWS